MLKKLNVDSTPEISVLETVISAEDVIFIKKGKNLKKVSIEEIIYVEVEERYCSLVTLNEKFLINISLKRIINYFENKNFVRTHRNYIINPYKILEITLSENLIIMEGNHAIILSNKYKSFLTNFIVF